MKETSKRLERLHALRCRMADAASADRRRVTQDLQATQRAQTALQEDVVAWFCIRGEQARSWPDLQAQLHLAVERNEQLMLRRQALLEAEEKALAAEQAAVQAREQMGHMLERLHSQMEREQARCEQARLDDLFATARVRAAMATSF